MSDSATLIKPPPVDPSKSAMENVLELTPLSDIGPDIYTNTRPLWHPPGARGIYGGAVIAQCLSAAQSTVPADFTIHSMHCYFVLAGHSEIPIIYHVEHIREGKSFATRTVQARQRGKPIFTTTMSFMRSGSGGKKLVEHAIPMPDVPIPPEDAKGNTPMSSLDHGEGPFVSKRIEVLNKNSPHPHIKKTRQWIKARGTISPAGGHQAHLSALAYMSDSYFIGTVSRVHQLPRNAAYTSALSKASLRKSGLSEEQVNKIWSDVADQEGDGATDLTEKDRRERPAIGMMVSLDHTIYFHDPRGFRADEWMLTEMETPWAGDGRGLVYQKMWSKDGILIASCVQEGVVRLKQQSDPQSKL